MGAGQGKRQVGGLWGLGLYYETYVLHLNNYHERDIEDELSGDLKKSLFLTDNAVTMNKAAMVVETEVNSHFNNMVSPSPRSIHICHCQMSNLPATGTKAELLTHYHIWWQVNYIGALQFRKEQQFIITQHCSTDKFVFQTAEPC
jgi:hypothetical protein